MIRKSQQIGRNDPCPCGSGKKYKKCCGITKEPIQVNIDGQAIPFSALLDSVAYHRRLAYMGSIGRKRKTFCIAYFEHKKKRLEYLAKAQINKAKSIGKSISCHKGCSFCCDEVIPVRIQESEAIVYFLYQNENALNTFISHYPTWYNQAIKHQDILTKIAQAKNRALFEMSDTFEQMYETIRTEARSFWDFHIHCPFLVDRTCSIYEIRPIACAGIYSLDPSTYCDPSSNIEPEIHSLFLPSENLDRSFWDDRLNVIYEDVLPNVVFNTLAGGFKYLSNLPGLGQLFEEFQHDPEFH